MLYDYYEKNVGDCSIQQKKDNSVVFQVLYTKALDFYVYSKDLYSIWELLVNFNINNLNEFNDIFNGKVYICALEVDRVDENNYSKILGAFFSKFEADLFKKFYALPYIKYDSVFSITIDEKEVGEGNYES